MQDDLNGWILLWAACGWTAHVWVWFNCIRPSNRNKELDMNFDYSWWAFLPLHATLIGPFLWLIAWYFWNDIRKHPR